MLAVKITSSYHWLACVCQNSQRAPALLGQHARRPALLRGAPCPLSHLLQKVVRIRPPRDVERARRAVDDDIDSRIVGCRHPLGDRVDERLVEVQHERLSWLWPLQRLPGQARAKVRFDRVGAAVHAAAAAATALARSTTGAGSEQRGWRGGSAGAPDADEGGACSGEKG